MRRLLLPAVLAGALLAGCADERSGAPGSVGEAPRSSAAEEQAMATIEGSVIYRERMRLPPQAILDVELQDVSRADAPARVLGSYRAAADSGPPYAFSIEYDPAEIDSRMRYSLRATLSVADKLLFTTTEQIDPFAGEPLELLVSRVPRGAPAEPGPALEGTHWGLVLLAGEDAGTGAGGGVVELTLDAATGSAAGFSGCNRYNGSYSLGGASADGAGLSFGPLASTRRACMEGMELEQRYLAALAEVNAYRLDGGRLVLLAGAEEVAVFEPL